MKEVIHPKDEHSLTAKFQGDVRGRARQGWRRRDDAEGDAEEEDEEEDATQEEEENEDDAWEEVAEDDGTRHGITRTYEMQ
jgi:hypothetical protein